MIIVYPERLNEFAKKHADSRKSLATRYDGAEKAVWKSKQDVLTDFPKAKMIKNNRARFEINHNTYRLIVSVSYDAQSVVIRFIGTHTEYDRIDPETI
jgi:mRNA interferase HigB